MTAVYRDGRSTHSGRSRRSSGGFTVGGIGDGYAGFVSVGNRGQGWNVSGALLVNTDSGHHGGHYDGYYGGHYGGYYGGYGYASPYYATVGIGFGYYSDYGYYTPSYYTPYYGSHVSYSYYPSSYYGASYVYDSYDPFYYGSTHTTVYVTEPAYEETTVYVDKTPEPQSVARPAPSLPEIVRDDPVLAAGHQAYIDRRYGDARRNYLTVMLADDDDGVAKFLYSLSNFALGDYDVATLALRRALVADPSLADRPLPVRTLYSQEFVLDTQLEDLAAYVSQTANGQDARLLLAYLHFAAGDVEFAHDVLLEVIKADPIDEVALRLREAVARQRGNG